MLWRAVVQALRRHRRRPQLVMWYPHPQPPWAGPLSAGVEVRPWQPGDDAGWLELLADGAQLGVWDPERVRRQLLADLVRPAPFFAVADGRLVAAAGVYDRAIAGRPSWEIGWVMCRPAFQGRGLGGQVVSASVALALSLPRRPIGLQTDDHRLPALGLYTRLGFEPGGAHRSYARRWRAVRDLLARRPATGQRRGDLP